MSQKQLLTLDTLDDRRELVVLLGKLSPIARVEFVQWACTLAPRGKGTLPVATVHTMQDRLRAAYRDDEADNILTNECYADLLQLINVWHVDPMKVVVQLEATVKQHSRR